MPGKTYRTLLGEMRECLQAAGVEAADLEARELLCFASGRTRAQLYRDLPLEVSPEAAQRAAESLERRLAGEPVAYLIGEWEFYGLTLTVTPDVLIPRTDTEVLAERTLAAIRRAGPGARVLDLCTGSGCVGLTAAARIPDCRVVLGDLSPRALEVCRRNIRRCGLEARAEARTLDALAAPPSDLGSFAVLTCNPPYIPRREMETLDRSVRDYEPWLALDGGEDGLDFYRSILGSWSTVLEPGGTLLFESGMGQAPAVEEMLRRSGFSDVRSTLDTGGILRVTEGRKIF